jgi:hypothetical protein
LVITAAHAGGAPALVQKFDKAYADLEEIETEELGQKRVLKLRNEVAEFMRDVLDFEDVGGLVKVTKLRLIKPAE